MRRPRGVTAIAVYHVLFSALLVGTLVQQGIAHHPAAGWLDAAPVLLMMLFLSLIPAVLAYGLWIMDDGARVGAILFTFLHLLTAIVYVQHVPWMWRPWTRIALDAAIIAVLLLPSIRRAFRSSSALLFSDPI
jgi:hypothetical protein